MSKKKKPREGATGQPAAPEINGWHFLIHFSDALFKFLAKAIWPLCTAFACVCIFWAVEAATRHLAGKKTDANIVADVSLKWGLDRIVAYLVGAGGAGYGVYQRKKRMENAAILRDQAQKQEMIMDKKRESSGLLPGGHMPQE